MTPEVLYEQKWATIVLDRSLVRLQRQYEETGRGLRFERLSPFLVGADTGCSYKDVAAALEVSVDAVKVAVHRLRKRFGRCLREEMADTVGHPDDVDDEIRHLLAVVEQWEPTGVVLDTIVASSPP